MKSIVTAMILILTFYHVDASSFKPICTSATPFTVYDLSIMKVKDFEQATGKHLNVIQRLSFKMHQTELRKTLRNHSSTFDGDLTTGFHAGGFFLGLLLGPIGVLLAYLISGDEDIKKNRKKWAWIGFSAFAAILVLILNTLKPVGA